MPSISKIFINFAIGKDSLFKSAYYQSLYMTQRANDIGLIKAGIKSRAEMLISLHEDDCIISSVNKLMVKCVNSLNKGGKIIICGNGGFAAIAQHTASELVGKLHHKRTPISAVALGTDLAVLTCISNDFGYERIFSRQLEAIGCEKDLLIVLSTSGKSKNILQALSQAREQQIEAFAFVGKSCGGLAEELGASVIEIPTAETESVQDITMIILHQICSCIEAELLKGESVRKNVWDTIITVSKDKGIKTLILDRDGVINHLLPNDYVLSKGSLSINNDFLTAAKSLAEIFEQIIIVSNQACVGKGIVSSDAIEEINSSIVQAIEQSGGRIDSSYICPDDNSDSPLRKPNIGVADQIINDYPMVDFHNAIVVGDSYSDELFAQRLGSMYFNVKNI